MIDDERDGMMLAKHGSWRLGFLAFQRSSISKKQHFSEALGARLDESTGSHRIAVVLTASYFLTKTTMGERHLQALLGFARAMVQDRSPRCYKWTGSQSLFIFLHRTSQRLLRALPRRRLLRLCL